MSLKRLPRLLPVMLVPFCLTACGGAQNPDRIATGHSTWLGNGFWDGLCLPVLLLHDILRGSGYTLYSRGHPLPYLIGYVLGVIVAVVIMLVIIDVISRAFPPRVAGLGRLAGIALMIIILAVAGR